MLIFLVVIHRNSPKICRFQWISINYLIPRFSPKIWKHVLNVFRIFRRFSEFFTFKMNLWRFYKKKFDDFLNSSYEKHLFHNRFNTQSKTVFILRLSFHEQYSLSLSARSLPFILDTCKCIMFPFRFFSLFRFIYTLWLSNVELYLLHLLKKEEWTIEIKKKNNNNNNESMRPSNRCVCIVYIGEKKPFKHIIYTQLEAEPICKRRHKKS